MITKLEAEQKIIELLGECHHPDITIIEGKAINWEEAYGYLCGKRDQPNIYCILTELNTMLIFYIANGGDINRVGLFDGFDGK